MCEILQVSIITEKGNTGEAVNDIWSQEVCYPQQNSFHNLRTNELPLLSNIEIISQVKSSADI